MQRINLAAAALATVVAAPFSAVAADNSLNPAISLVLQGQFSDYQNDPESYELPGFMLGGEAGLAPSGFGLGHGELVMSAAVDDAFFAKMTLAIADHEGATETELEEAYVETLALGQGFSLRFGRFLSSVGYLNEQHIHAWDFVDAPLIYRGLFGDQLIDDGIQLRWLAPTDLFLQAGVELGRGERFPAGGASHDGQGSAAVFVEVGGDIGISQSWQLGLSHWESSVSGRESGGHAHTAEVLEIPSYSGDSRLSALDVVWKWAPDGNYAQRYLKVQFEYFERDENGMIELENSDPLESTSYQGQQSGWYLQAVYQLRPQWRVGVRYDQLKADNTGSDADVLGEAGLDSEGHEPKRSSAMLEYAHSEFSQLRLQFNRDESYENADEQIYLQYVMSLGAHPAHAF